MSRHPVKTRLAMAAALAAAVATSAISAERMGGPLKPPPLERPASRDRVPGPQTPGSLPGAGTLPGIAGPSKATRPEAQESRPVIPSTSITYRGTSYVVTGGQWYQQRGTDLVAVTAPNGVMVRDLPDGYSMHWIGGVPYFYAGGLYYVWRERARQYEILQSPPAREPEGAREKPAEGSAP